MAIKIRHVYGNVLRLAIPLDVKTVTIVNGIVNQEESQFYPNAEFPTTVVLKKTATKFSYDARVDGNVVSIEDVGTLPIGVYQVEVLCRNEQREPMRYMVRGVVEIVDATIDAGIEAGIEFNAETYTLDGGVFLALTGRDGVGIESITTDETDVEGAYNTVTFNLTDGTSTTIRIRNGATGTPTLPPDIVRDENYVHTDNNFGNNEVIALETAKNTIPKLFGQVFYDKISRRISFFAYGDQNRIKPLGYIDATPFIRDSTIQNFRVANGRLEIIMNSESEISQFFVPLTNIFNSDEYYTKQQADNLISGKASLDQTTGRLSDSQATRVVLDYIVGVGTEDEHEAAAGMMWYENGLIMCSKAEGYNIIDEPVGLPNKDILYCNAEDNNTYRWTGSSWQQVGGGSGQGSGYTASVVNHKLVFTGSQQPQVVNHKLIL